MTQQSRLSNFIAELRRRRVFRVAAFYGGIAFVIIQIIDGAFSYLHIPEWFGTAIIVLLLVGFPVSMILAWVFDITEEGIVRTKGRTAAKKSKPGTSNRALIAVTIVAITFGIWGRWGNNDSDSRPVIAVLPFKNYSAEADDWFADGFTDVLTSQLAKIPGLRVTSRTSTMYYKNTSLSAAQVGLELGATIVLEGSVLRSGGKVLITGQLIDTDTNHHIGSESYERSTDDAIALQTDVALAIARALETELTPEEELSISELPTSNPVAFDLYLRGRAAWNNFELLGNDFALNGEWLVEAIGLFEEAVTLDPSFGLAHYEIIRLNAGIYFNGWDRSVDHQKMATEALYRAEANVSDKRVLQMIRRTYYFYAQRDYPRALSEMEPLLADRADDPDVLMMVGLIYRRTDRIEEGLDLLIRASTLNPHFALLTNEIFEMYRKLHRYKEAERFLERLRFMGATDRYATRSWIAVEGYGDLDLAWQILEEGVNELGPGPLDGQIVNIAFYRRDFDLVLDISRNSETMSISEKKWNEATMLFLMGKVVAAKEVAQRGKLEIKSHSKYGFSSRDYRRLAAYAAIFDDREMVDAWVDSALALSNPAIDSWNGPIQLVWIAFVYSIMKDEERVLDLLEESFQYHSNFTVNDLELSPDWDFIRENPRYIALVQRLKGGR